MYNHKYLDPDDCAKSLQRKVQFDIRFYFARRGAENMEKMRKNTFKLSFDTKSETWFVLKDLDELTKNHKYIDKKVSGYMPENKDDRLCPVRSFRKYIEHLHPENEFLWQRPLDRIDPRKPEIWYGKQHLGKTPLGHYMSDVSEKCALSKIYTNHSIRVTGVTVLTRMNFSSSEIMSITGHKTVQSLTRYQRTQDREKISMGNVMHQSLTREEDTIVVPAHGSNQDLALQHRRDVGSPKLAIAAMSRPVMEKENVCDAIVPFNPQFDDDIPDFDLIQLLKEVEQEEKPKTPPHTTTKNSMMSSNVVNNVPKSLFHNCTIQNITFNMK